MNKIVKVYNNNAVAAISDKGTECVLIGSGIGFGRGPGDIVPEAKIEKKYYVQNELQTKFLKLLESSTRESLEISEKIVEQAQKELDIRLSPQALVTLSDHISFAIERHKKGINLPNLLADEVKLLYPAAYNVGLWGVQLIKKQTGIELYEDEASYITMHIADASIESNKKEIVRTLKFVRDIVDIIKDVYGISPKSSDGNYIRLTTHLKFLASEIFRHEQLSGEDFDDMLALLMRKNNHNRRCIDEITAYIQNEYGYSLNNSEIAYLLIYINRIL